MSAAGLAKPFSQADELVAICSRPRFQFQSADTLEFLNVVRHQRQAGSEGFACDEQIVRPDGLAPSFQVGSNPSSPLRCGAAKREFDDGGNEAFDFLALFRRVLGFLNAAKQFIDGNHRNGAVHWRELAQPLHHAGPLPKHADARVRIQEVGHALLQVLDRRQLALLWTLERAVRDVDGIEEAFWPSRQPCRFQHDGITFLTDGNGRRQVDALGQADDLAPAFDDDRGRFHKNILGYARVKTKPESAFCFQAGQGERAMKHKVSSDERPLAQKRQRYGAHCLALKRTFSQPRQDRPHLKAGHRLGRLRVGSETQAHIQFGPYPLGFLFNRLPNTGAAAWHGQRRLAQDLRGKLQPFVGGHQCGRCKQAKLEFPQQRRDQHRVGLKPADHSEIEYPIHQLLQDFVGFEILKGHRQSRVSRSSESPELAKRFSIMIGRSFWLFSKP